MPVSSPITATPLIGMASIAGLVFSNGDVTTLHADLLQRINDDPEDAHALFDMATLFLAMNNAATGLAVQAEALKLQQLYHVQAPRSMQGVRVLAVQAPGDFMTNTPIEFLVAGRDIGLDILFVGEQGLNDAELPEHDVLFIGVSESDATQALLVTLGEQVATWQRPVVNTPAHIAALSRTGVWERLHDATGCVMPRGVRVARATVEQVAAGARWLEDILPGDDFPIIIRPQGTHAGKGLEKIDDVEALQHYLDMQVADEFHLSRYVDYASADGQFRKYRLVLIEGRPFVAHMAISSHWMVHYLNAGMTENATKRAEEAAHMRDFDNDFAVRHAAAFEAIHARLGLAYVGIDCAETPDGKLLVFEMDQGMIVHALDDATIFPYKKPQMEKIFSAFETMLRRACHMPGAPIID